MAHAWRRHAADFIYPIRPPDALPLIPLYLTVPLCLIQQHRKGFPSRDNPTARCSPTTPPCQFPTLPHPAVSIPLPASPVCWVCLGSTLLLSPPGRCARLRRSLCRAPAPRLAAGMYRPCREGVATHPHTHHHRPPPPPPTHPPTPHHTHTTNTHTPAPTAALPVILVALPSRARGPKFAQCCFEGGTSQASGTRRRLWTQTRGVNAGADGGVLHGATWRAAAKTNGGVEGGGGVFYERAPHNTDKIGRDWGQRKRTTQVLRDWGGRRDQRY